MNLFPAQDIKDIRVGDLLISEPFLSDDNFTRSVILICDDTDGQHLGFTINKELEGYNLGHLVDPLSSFDKSILVGGPVQKTMVQVLHTDPLIPETQPVGSGIYWGGDFEVIIEKLNNDEMKIEETWFFLGYSGWGKDQLLQEISEKSWLVLRHDIKLILDMDIDDIWKKCVSFLGKKFDIITKFPTNPRLN